jgi:UDP-N-acetylglucosamine--N-acetylmuramyl-(pentapeptide) pyrophosphoryl-undecaprenol N-acetylglucosamine transferase
LVYGFTNELRLLSEASDVVITRAGATALTEFSIQKQAMIIVPNNQLTGGHQLQNARVYQENSAAVLVDEDENTQEVLYKTVNELLDNPAERGRLGESAEQLVKKDAAENVVDILIKLHRKK